MMIFKKNKFSRKKYPIKEGIFGFAFGAFLVLGIFIYSLYSFAAWTSPTVAPPGGNVPEPINTGTAPQNKLGTFKIGTTTAPASVGNLILYNGKAAIGTSTLGTAGLLVANSGHNVNVVDVNTNRIVGLSLIPINSSEATSKFYADWVASTSKFWTGNVGGNIWNLNTGNVGIGTTNPSYVLAVAGGATGAAFAGSGGLRIQSNDFGVMGGGTYTSITGSTIAGGGMNAVGSNPMHIISGDNSSNILLAETGGNVGIGTTDASRAKFVTSGFVGNTSAIFGQGNAGVALSVSPADILFNAYISGGYKSMAAGSGAIISGSNGILSFLTGSNAAAADLPVTMTTAMTILNNGNVGIGTTNPRTALYTVGIIQASDGGATERILGLDINSSRARIEANYWGAGGTYVPMTFYTGGNERARIDTSGNVAIGTSSTASYRLTVDGTMAVKGDIKIAGQVNLGWGDLAEEFYTDKNYPAGTVLVMDNKSSFAKASADEGYKSARACTKKYDSTVIGVISENPGLVIGKIEAKFKAPVALNGVIKVRVNNSGGQIQQGDLLTTSAISGEAMLAANPKIGTIIGKALENDTGKGWVMALVNLK
jgi:hypothetical protein